MSAGSREPEPPVERELEQKGLMADLAFVQEGLRQNQRERQVFLGFTVAATVAVFGLMLRQDDPLSAGESLSVLGILSVVIMAAELLTIHSTRGVKSGGAYIRLFLEPRIPGVAFQTHQHEFDRKFKTIGFAYGMSLAYGLLSFGPLLAWISFVDGQTCLQSVLIGVFTVLLLIPSVVGLFLRWPPSYWDKPETLWKSVREEHG